MKNKILRKMVILAGFLLVGTSTYCQAPSWGGSIPSSNLNYYDIVSQTQAYFDSTGLDTVPHSGYKDFKRWEYTFKNLGSGTSNGGFQDANTAMAVLFQNSNLICNGSTFYPNNWEFVGHNKTTGTSQSRGQGIIMTVYVDYKNDPTLNTIYVGTANSGLWKTTNAKSSTPQWSCITNSARMPLQGVSGIAVNPSNPNVIYISTGCWRGTTMNNFYSMGIIKTTDGGNSWQTTGLSYDINNPSDYIVTQNVYLAPWKHNGNDVLYVLKQNKIFYSNDAGVSFTQAFSNSSNKNWRDLRFLNSNKVIASTDGPNGEVWQATNKGQTSVNWTNITSSVFSSGLSSIRVDLDVYENNKNIIYVSGAGQGSTIRLAYSGDGGTSWSDWNVNTGQARDEHENDIAISKSTPTRLYSAGKTVGMSTNGGQTFTNLFGYWNDFVHPDQRALFTVVDGQGNDIVYSGHDGGISRANAPQTGTNGSDWQLINGEDLNISETIGVGVNLNEDWIATGLFDMGWYDYRNGSWENYRIADGLSTIFDPFSSPNRMYVESNYGIHSLNEETFPQNVNFPNIGIQSNESWDQRIVIDSRGNIYQGGANRLHRRLFGSNTFSQIFTRGGGIDGVSAIAPSPSNPNVLYVGFEEPMWGNPVSLKFFKSTNALSSNPTYSDISSASGLDLAWNSISDIVVDPNNENEVWVCNGQLINQTGKRVYYSTNGGNSFVQLKPFYYCDGTTPMPWAVTRLVIDEATGGMYAATDIGVYYNPNPKDINSDWVLYNKDFPVVRVTDMQINYCTRKLYVSTYGRGLYKCDLAEPADINQTITVSNYLNIPIGETRIFNSNVTIPTGATMTVKGLVRMATDRTITVQPGAKLLVDGGTITSTCDLPWGGVIVEGNPSLSQIPYSNQGYVRMTNNATISNAWNAIRLIGINSAGGLHWGKVGGIIQSTNSQFKNNWRDVEFMSYRNMYGGNELPNQSKFITTRFTTDVDNKIPNNTLWPHVTMWDVYLPRFEGCVFEDTRSLVSKWQGRTGIYTSSSSYKVGSYCSGWQIPCNGIPSEFNNLADAIESYGDRSRGPISIENSIFNSYKGVLLQGTNGALVRSNTFNIEHDPITPGNTEYPYGLYLDMSQDFNTEGNQFQGIGDAQNDGAAGLVIRNTGPNNNKFYRSNFDDLRLGSQALHANKMWMNGFIGLTFRCNDYENDWDDLDIRFDPNTMVTYPSGYIGMREFQGQNLNSPPLLPDNEFGNSSSILNYSIENDAHYMQYSYSGAPNISNKNYPYIVTPHPTVSGQDNVLRAQISGLRVCPDKISTWGGDREMLISEIGTLEPLMMIKMGEWKELEDEGNTPAVLSAVESASVSNISQILSDLTSYSPHLGIEVLQAVASANSPFTNENVRDILVLNPHSARSATVQEALDNRLNPLPQSYRDTINNQITSYTTRDNLQEELVALVGDYDDKLTELLSSYITDTSSVLSDYAQWFEHPFNPTLRYQLATIYFDLGDWSSYTQILNDIPLDIPLDALQLQYHTAYSDLYSQLHSWELANEPVYGDIAKKDWLLNYAQSHSIYPNRVNALLSIHDTIIAKPYVYIDYIENASSQQAPASSSSDQLENENNMSLVNLFPNPTKNKVTLEWKEEPKEATVTVLNTFGVKVYSENWIENTPLSFEVGGWRQGAYFVIIETPTETIRRNLLISR